ncbi:AzlD domain-containing protein [Leeia oryzae]|uniref:AzlD domain-containing protein n=1 Tax=Leeia oryzae TaxID=356662 RepID=UPI00037E54E4|nr:AzlD domain-containing protein [Leeia oryzae]
MNYTLMIVGMMVATFATRAIFFVLGDRIRFSETLKTALGFVPVTVLTAITVPMLLVPNGSLDLSYRNPWLVGGVVTVFTALLQKNPLVTIVIGLAAFFAYKHWLL